MSTSVSSSKQRPKRRRPGSPRRILITVSATLSVLLVAGIVMFKGNVKGIEFAPSHFQTREFSFYEVPFLEIQLSPIRRNLISDKVSSYLRSNSLISTPRGKPPTEWHIVSISRGPTSQQQIASLLTESIWVGDFRGSHYWVQWNTDHPKRAAVLWPIVQRLALRQLYVLIPPLLQIARSLPGDDDANSFQQAIDKFLIAESAELTKDLRLANREDLANEILHETIGDYPESQTLLSLQKSIVESSDEIPGSDNPVAAETSPSERLVPDDQETSTASDQPAQPN
ncbi:hypothetical protein LOC67_09865 [Stieleria sp. JC731]|uniref:hypothetical protein n=1 Tax=Pirellulaceae TaxID=2691357 RepID=UPI001E350E1B|nr:hypothetical protein [Stieleria sp. JC731]MCC9600872.1 hypothetical protein [Stieleria sp. JC731]